MHIIMCRHTERETHIMFNRNKKRIIICIAAVLLIAAIIVIIVLWKSEDIKHVSINEAEAELKDFSFKHYDNLTFECNPHQFDTQELAVYKIESPDEYKDNDDKENNINHLCEKEKELFGYSVDKTKITSSVPGELEYYMQDEAYCVVYPSHTFSFINGKEYDRLLRDSGNNDTDMNTYTDLREDANKTLKVNGKDFDMKKAAEYAKESFDKNFADLFNDDEQILPADAIGVKGSNGELTYVVVRLLHTLNGIGVNENGYDTSYLPDVYVKPSYMLAIMTADNEIISYTNSYYYNILDKKTVKDIIPLSTATDILSNSLAENLKYKVKDVRLKYTTVMNGKSSQNKDNQQTEMRPMWSFVFEYSSGNSSIFANSITAYVDAIDGTAYYCSSEGCEESEPILK